MGSRDRNVKPEVTKTQDICVPIRQREQTIIFIPLEAVS